MIDETPGLWAPRPDRNALLYFTDKVDLSRLPDGSAIVREGALCYGDVFVDLVEGFIAAESGFVLSMDSPRLYEVPLITLGPEKGSVSSGVCERYKASGLDRYFVRNGRTEGIIDVISRKPVILCNTKYYTDTYEEFAHRHNKEKEALTGLFTQDFEEIYRLFGLGRNSGRLSDRSHQ